MNPDFGSFIQDAKGPLWRECFADQDEAERQAEQVAKIEGFECFVFNLATYTEVVRFYPASQKGRDSKEEWHLPSGPETKT